MSVGSEERLLEKREDLGMLELAREHLISEEEANNVIRPSDSIIPHEVDGSSFTDLLGLSRQEIEQQLAVTRTEFERLAGNADPDYSSMERDEATNLRLALKEYRNNLELPEGVKTVVDGEPDLRAKWGEADELEDVEEEFAEMIYAFREFSDGDYGKVVRIWEPEIPYEDVDNAMERVKQEAIHLLESMDEEEIKNVWNDTGANIDDAVTLQDVTDSSARVHEFMANYILGGNPVKMPVRLAGSGMEYGNSVMAPLQTTSDYFWAKSLDTTAHEFGHTFGRENLSEENMFLPLGEPPSEAVDEGSARFYQNHVFRSREFQEFLTDESQIWLRAHNIPEFDPENMHGWFNAINPENNRRVSADPITYPLHVAVRYELEKELIESEKPVEEMTANLHSRWQEKMQNYIGDNIGKEFDLDESETVLQDVHWGKGKFGYFPSYTLGDIMAAQWSEAIDQELDEELSDYVREARLEPINNWMVDSIWSHGKAVWERSDYVEFDVEPYIDHLRERAEEIY